MDKYKSPILAHSRPAIERLRRHRWAAAGVGGFALLGMMAAFALVPAESQVTVAQQTVLEQLAVPVLTPVDTSLKDAVFLHEERILASDTLSSVLARLGIDDPAALEFIRRDATAQTLARQLRPGKVVTARTRDDGQLIALHFPLNGRDATLLVERTENGFSASERILPLETQIVVKSGEIRSSLFAATDSSGIPEGIAVQLAEIFSGDIDFYRDLRKGDRFHLVYETLCQQGQSTRAGRILTAEFINNQKTYNAFWFQGEDGKGGYYSADGKNLRKAFLRSPLAFSRVTSGFSPARLHPVLKIMRAHKGIDYAAPIGTKVRSVADGSVEFAGGQGGYGNLIVIRHQGAFSTAYGHLSRFAPGIRKGSRVSQGETIAYSGQTGIASGPHLHYEFRVNSQQVNPLATTLPAAIPLNASQTARFKESIEPLKAQLALARQINLASTE